MIWRTLLSVVALLASSSGALLVLAPTAVLPPAGAATCSTASGVSVVVDYKEIGGGIVTGCAPTGGSKSAAAIFAEAGVALSYASRQPGFVCRVNDQPTTDPCVNTSPADAYWGLWWSDGTGSSWTYSPVGVGGLSVPAGGSVAWAWQLDRGDAPVPPGIPAPVIKKTPSPTPTAPPTSGGGGGKGGGRDGGKGDGGRDGGSSPAGSTSTPSPTSSGTPSPGATSGSSPSAAPTTGHTTGPTTGSPTDRPRKGQPSVPAEESPTVATTDIPEDGAAASAEEPTRVPAVVIWGIVGLLGIAIGVSTVLTRRRRGA